jgi:PadR family transcriptional regulator, regulatory protein PadR
MNAWITQLRKGLMDFCVLNLLRHGESYGYEIVQSLKSIEELVVTESTVYPILSRLGKDGYLHVRIQTSTEGPPRRYFSLTSAGRQRAAEMNAYWRALQRAIGGLMQDRVNEEGRP